MERLAVVALVAATAALPVLALHGRRAPAARAPERAWVDVSPPRPLRDWRLVDERGAPWPADAFVGAWTVIEVGYTSCPDVCPTGLARLAEVLAIDQGLRAVFVAVDPARDRARLREYVGFFDPRLRGATGEPADLDRALAELGASYERLADGTVDHSTAYFVVDPQASVVAAIPPPATAAELAAALAEVRAAHQPALVAELWSRPQPPGAPGIAYGRLVNRGRAPLAVSAVGAELHRTVLRDGRAHMEPVAALTLAPGETVTLAPRGLHLMLPARGGPPLVELRTADGVGHLFALAERPLVAR